MATITTTANKSATQIFGTAGASAAVAANASLTSTSQTMTADFEAALIVEVQIGASAPTTAPSLQFQWSPDGTNFYSDGGPISVPTTPSTNFDYTYVPPRAAQKARANVTNGATNGINVIGWGASVDSLSSL